MYATRTDLNTRFGETKMTRLAQPDEQDRVLQDASELINGYLISRYTLPLTDVPVVLVHICCDITRYLLHDSNVPEAVKDRYNQAMQMLEKYSKGTLLLFAPENEQLSADNVAQFESSPTLFNRKNNGFI